MHFAIANISLLFDSINIPLEKSRKKRQIAPKCLIFAARKAINMFIKVGDLEIEVVRKAIRHLILRVRRDGTVSVSAPRQTTEADIRAFVASRAAWIAKARARVAASPPESRWPQWEPTEALRRFRTLREQLRPLVQRYAAAMGVEVRGLRIKAMTSRWGSCNVRTHVVTFNLYLSVWPDECVESVVVHELAHLLVPNHSPAFYAVMDRHFPQWRTCRSQMRGPLPQNPM